jgi:hypothetical protein
MIIKKLKIKKNANNREIIIINETKKNYNK